MQRTNSATVVAIGSTVSAAILAAFSPLYPPLSGVTLAVVLLATVGVAAATVAARGGDLA